MPSPRKTGKKKPAHRPYKPIDWAKVDKYLKAGCNGIQIAAKFNMNHDTFYSRVEIEKKVSFTEYSSSKKSDGEADLLLQQFEDALGISKVKGNTQLLLMLGEERLGQGKKKIDTTQMSKDDWRQLVQDIERDTGISKDSRPSMANQSPILDQRPLGEQDQVQSELGAESPMGRSSSSQDNPESTSAGYNDVFVPNFT